MHPHSEPRCAAGWLAVLAAVALAGCATRPIAPTPAESAFKPPASGVAASHTGLFSRTSNEAAVAAAHEVLLELGYAPTSGNPSAGVIFASKETVHRTPAKRTVLTPVGSVIALTAGLPTLAAIVARGGTAKDVSNIVWPEYVEHACIDRLSLTLARGADEGDCIARLVLQRAFPKSGAADADRFDGGWIVADPAVHRDFFARVAAKLAPHDAR